MLGASEIKSVDDLIRQLEQLDNRSVQSGISQHYIELVSKGTETVLFGNKEGLIWLHSKL